MFSSWATIIIGWPAVIAAAFLAVSALVVKSPRLLLVAAVVATPFGLYILGSPVLWPAAAFCLLTFYAASVALRRRGVLLAAGLVAPFFLLASFLALRS